jgi:hypothetical protein
MNAEQGETNQSNGVQHTSPRDKPPMYIMDPITFRINRTEMIKNNKKA